MSMIEANDKHNLKNHTGFHGSRPGLRLLLKCLKYPQSIEMHSVTNPPPDITLAWLPM